MTNIPNSKILHGFESYTACVFFVLKLFLQSIVTCPVNVPKFCSVRLEWYILKPEKELTSFEFVSLFKVSYMYLIFVIVNNLDGSRNTD